MSKNPSFITVIYRSTTGWSWNEREYVLSNVFFLFFSLRQGEKDFIFLFYFFQHQVSAICYIKVLFRFILKEENKKQNKQAI